MHGIFGFLRRAFSWKAATKAPKPRAESTRRRWVREGRVELALPEQLFWALKEAEGSPKQGAPAVQVALAGELATASDISRARGFDRMIYVWPPVAQYLAEVLEEYVDAWEDTSRTAPRDWYLTNEELATQGKLALRRLRSKLKKI